MTPINGWKIYEFYSKASTEWFAATSMDRARRIARSFYAETGMRHRDEIPEPKELTDKSVKTLEYDNGKGGEPLAFEAELRRRLEHPQEPVEGIFAVSEY